jgi:hypothetical protein
MIGERDSLYGEWPLRHVVSHQFMARTYPGSQPFGRIIRLSLSCGHTIQRPGKSGVPKRVHCRECGEKAP